MLRIFFDGLCEPKNPGGIACYGFAIFLASLGRDSPLNTLLYQEQGLATTPWTQMASNNVAEYSGLFRALEWMLKNTQEKEIEILGDSQLVIRQLNGIYGVHAERIIPLYEKVMALLKQLSWKATWIPREENSIADELSMKAYRDYCMEKHGKVFPTTRERFKK